MVELRGEWARRRLSTALALLIVLGVFLPVSGYAPVGPAMPGLRSASAQSFPSWMTPEQVALFTNDWPALVPSYVPEPFASVVPSITIDGGYYRLYWFVGGGAPTFLDVQGYLSGYIPAGSAYDLNVELKVNATVRGNEAYHDPTPIYDAVYWREGGPSYWANSRNLGTDIVSYANSFTTVTAPAPEPTATVPAPAVLYSPDSIAAGGSGMVTAIGGGAEATIVADGGYFPDTGTASYPGAGDASVSWVAPDVTVDTTVTFSLVDASGAVLVTTPTLVTTVAAPVSFSLVCDPTVSAGNSMSVSVTGSGNVMLDASAGSWPQTSPNTDYDPGTDGVTLAFTLGDGGTATLTWSAPSTTQTATIQAYGPSGMVVGSCQVEVSGPTPTMEPTVPVATSTIPATAPPVGPVTIPATVQPAATATAGAAQPAGTSTSTVPGTTPGDGTVPGSGAEPTVPGTGTGDGIDTGQGAAPTATATARPGDGIDPGGEATAPAGATYPAIPTSAPLPDAPPTSIPPTGAGPTVPGQTPQVTAPGSTATTMPTVPLATATLPAPTATASSGAPIIVPLAPATRIPATATSGAVARTPTVVPTIAPTAPSTATSTTEPPTAVATIAAPTAPAPTATASAPTVTAPAPTATSPAPTATAPAPTATATLQPIATMLPASPVSTSTPPVPTPTATTAALVAQATAPVTATLAPLTATPAPATPTSTSVPPTATTIPPTVTTVPATPTATSLPATPTPTATVPPPTATATRRPAATATATPIRAGQEPPMPGALLSSPVATIAPTFSPTALPATPLVSGSTPTPTPLPASANVTEQIGPDGGTVQHPAGAELDISDGVFDSIMSVSMTQIADGDLPVSSDVDLVPSSGYDIEITGVDGRAVTTLPAGVVLRLSVPKDVRGDAVVYWIDDGDLTQLGVTNQEEAGISAPLAHLSRYVAGIPLEENPELGWLPWTVAIAAAISGLLIVGLLANQSRRQRRRGVKASRTG